MGEGRRDERTPIPLKFCLVSGKALDELAPPNGTLHLLVWGLFRPLLDSTLAAFWTNYIIFSNAQIFELFFSLKKTWEEKWKIFWNIQYIYYYYYYYFKIKKFHKEIFKFNLIDYSIDMCWRCPSTTIFI